MRQNRRVLRKLPPWLPVFLAAVAVRLVYLSESVDNPVFWTPVVDAETYDRLARALAGGAAPTADLFWQPLFYPLVLALLHAATSGSIVAAKLVQACLGAVTCALTCTVAAEIFERRTGIVAGWLVALYGPLVFYDGELLATGWACFWSAALLWLSLRALRGAGAPSFFVLGACGGLAVLCQTSFLPCLAPLAALPFRAGARAAVARGAGLVAGLALVLVPAVVASARYAERASLLPGAAGINLYIGNNPATDRTLALRPGWEWSELTRLPERHGIERRSETSKFFRTLVRDYAWAHPARFAGGLLGKTLQLASPRELPRNVDLYVVREWSWVLRVLVWKIGVFGFPFGVLLPLAIRGAALRSSRRLEVLPLVWLVLAYGAAIVAVFPTGRYRAPLVPALAVLAAASIVDLQRGGTARALRVLAVAVLCGVLLGIPGPFPQERGDYEQELLYLAGAAARKHGELDRAVELLSAAVAREPADSDAHNQLGNAWAERGRADLALRHYALAAEAAPDNALARDNHGRALLAAGRAAEAARELAAAVALRPRSAQLHRLLEQARAQAGLVPPPGP